MKKYLIIFMLTFIYVGTTSSQTIKLNGGLSISSLNSSKVVTLENHLYRPFVTLGIDYMEHKYWNLSSEIGFIGKGGKRTVRVIGDQLLHESTNLTEDRSNLHLNTTFQGKLPITEHHYFFAGLGPAIDILIGTRKIKSEYIGISPQRITFDVKADAGYGYQFQNGIKLGITYSYLYTLSPYGKYDNINIYNGTHLFSLLFGCPL